MFFVLVPDSTSTVIHSGWLQKQSGWLDKKWTSRWFVLYSSSTRGLFLVYYIDETLNDQRQTYDITPGCSVYSVYAKTTTEFKFVVSTSNRFLELTTNDSSVRSGWITELNNHIKLSGQVKIPNIKSSLTERSRSSVSTSDRISTDTFDCKKNENFQKCIELIFFV